MSQSRFAVTVLLASLWLCACASASAAQSATTAVRPSNNALAARGFDELYNADYDLAIRDLSRLESEHPDDPFTSNYLLAAEVFQELNRIGALDTETYSSESFLTSKARRPLDMGAQQRIFDLISRVESLCNARLERNSDDTDALYARGVARGFRSTYMGMAENCSNSQLHYRFAELGGTRGGSAGWRHRQPAEGPRISAGGKPLARYFKK
jgi:hypothetical protein